MKNKWIIVSTGFAMFSMFFGSGNLVFPITVGKESEGHFLLAALGIILTGVVMPFLGAIAMMLYNGDSKRFFGTMGKSATFWFPFLSLSLMGPFGVLARCITVAHGSFRILIPETSLWAFSLIFCLLVFLITLRKNTIIPLLGSYLTPLLLLLLAGITFFGLTSATFPSSLANGQMKALTNGFIQGYQTMDLLAAFFFSSFVIQHLAKYVISGKKEETPTPIIFVKSSLVGGSILAIVYLALVILGNLYSIELTHTAPTEMLGIIAQKVLGQWAAPVVCATIFLACLTTAVVLATLFADFLKIEISQKKLTAWQALAITLVIAFFVSTLEFSGIAKFLGPILETIYPALITLTIVNMANQLWGTPMLRWPVAATFLIKLFCF
jgi:branched-chain amino acid:cation transporter, LIVCS family